MVRTSISIPRSLKKEMEKRDVNWSSILRKAIRKELEQGDGADRVEAVILNEKMRRKAPEGWESSEVIRSWRERRR